LNNEISIKKAYFRKRGLKRVYYKRFKKKLPLFGYDLKCHLNSLHSEEKKRGKSLFLKD